MAKASSQNMSVAEAAKLLKLSKPRVHDYIREGRLRAERIGTMFVVKRSDVLAFKPMPRGRPKLGKKK